MNENPDTSAPGAELSRADQHSALFANLVLQQSNMAMLLMGRTAPAGSDKPIKDLEAAQLFIDQLEMLEAKTKGNLSNQESAMLKQTLMALRLEFVEAVGSGGSEKKPQAEPAAGGAPDQAPTPAPGAEEAHKKFSKKY